jgi:hypothetical protein
MIADTIANIVTGVLYFCQFMAAVYSFFFVQLAPVWLLIYKPRKVGSYIDTKILEVFQTKFRFNFGESADLPAANYQHSLFVGWLFLLTAIHFYFFTSLWNFVGFTCFSGILVFLAISFFGKFLREFPGRREIAISYLNKNWKSGIFVLSFLLVFAKILTDIWTYIRESALFKFTIKAAKYAAISLLLIYVFLLMSTSFRIDRDVFVQFCARIHPALATFTKNFHENIADKP